MGRDPGKNVGRALTWVIVGLALGSIVLVGAGLYLDAEAMKGIGGAGLIVSLLWNGFRTNNTEPYIEYELFEIDSDGDASD